MAGVGESVIRFAGNVCNLNYLALKDGPPYERPGVWCHRPDLMHGIKCDPVEIVMGYDTDHLPIEVIYDTVSGSAQIDGIVGDCIKHGLNVCR